MKIGNFKRKKRLCHRYCYTTICTIIQECMMFVCSALDAESERVVQEALDQVSKGKFNL